MTKWLDSIEEGSFLYCLVIWAGALFAIAFCAMAIIFPIMFAESLPVWLIILLDTLFICGTAFCAAIPSFLVNRY